MGSDTRYSQNFSPFPLVQCRILSISSTQAVGHTFHFLGIPGSRPNPQYIFLIHNHQLWILFSPILYTLSTTIHTIIPTKYQTISYSQISKYHSYFLSRHSISLSTIYSPYPGAHFPLTKISQNTLLYPLLHTSITHSFSIKNTKKWIKIAIFQSVDHSVTSYNLTYFRYILASFSFYLYLFTPILFLFDQIKSEKPRIHAGFPDVYLKCIENDHSSEHKIPICTNLYSPIAINGLI